MAMEMKLELVPIPVSDVDRAKTFYADKLGFHADLDVQPAHGVRVLQLTPPGSSCSIVIASGLPEIAKMQPGSIKGLHLIVADARAAGEALTQHGVKVSDVEEHDRGVKYVSFSDPDGNSWVFQEMPWRSKEFS
jgi:catechol 2,3-dioxygenase-like lactoylglutathione lyase family enzyme